MKIAIRKITGLRAILRATCLCGMTCLLAFSKPAAARTYEGVLQEPVVLGAWLFTGKCMACHGTYAKDRLAEEYDDQDELAKAIGSGGCKVIWARRGGGILGVSELAALAAYMLRWEEEEKEPLLPELPAQPVEPAPDQPAQAARGVTLIMPPAVTEEQQLTPPLTKLITTNPVAEGGWLYTRNCHRCHLSYRQARLGKGIERETLRRTISEGKTSTQMKGFSRVLGGNLKSSEIKAVVTFITTWERKGEPLAIAAELMTPPAVDPADFVPVRLPKFQAVTGDPKAGATLFIKHCLSCHGTRGEGYIGTSLHEETRVPRPDLFFKSIIKRGIPGSLMKSWTDGSAETLSAKDIDDIVSALLAWSKERLSEKNSR